uniref:Ig-like domain-containing protein n=1 Tax=Astyanax mexicanus TaxID=7994 RepID=A0A3B1IKA1_ASTMX
ICDWTIRRALLMIYLGEERVEQPVRDVTSSEGTSVTLECTYETSSPQPNLFWYIQRSHDFPKYILRRDKYSAGDNGTQFHERMNSAVQSTSVPLSIQKLSGPLSTHIWANELIKGCTVRCTPLKQSVQITGYGQGYIST